MHTTLSPMQEAIAVELRRLLFLPLDDWLQYYESSSTLTSPVPGKIGVCGATVSPACARFRLKHRLIQA